jgi:transposase
VPQFRNIERFWAHLKINVYYEGWTAGSVEQLIRKIKREIKKFPESYFQSLLSRTKTKI